MSENSPPKVIPVKAVLRGRPLIRKEIDEGCQTCLEFISESNQVVLSGNKAFTFDHVFDSNICQEDVYNTAVKPLTKGIFKGYHATVLAYGQTGSGKTYSMGSAYSTTNSNEDSTGIIPRVIADIFSGIEERMTHDFTVKVSYLELYKKDLYDLLCAVADRQPITIRDSDDGGTQTTGLTELVVCNIAETLHAMDKGNSRRTTAATAMNLVSSRSHAIFTIVLEASSKENSNDKIVSKFHLVDLAGSERAKRTKAEGERLQEGIKINEGLLALGNVISALADENLRSGHIRYRDSKLTRILQSSLGGNSHTLMIACVSPADSNHEETLNTLRYADRVRKIKNKPVVNRDPQAALIASLKQEIQNLNLQLLERGGGIPSSSIASFRPGQDGNRNMIEKVKKYEEEISQLTEQLQQSVESHADMCEKAIIAEMGRDKMQTQITDIVTNAKDIISEFPDLFVVEGEIENQSIKDRYLKLLALQKLVVGLNTCGVEINLENGLNNEETVAGDDSPQSSFNCDNTVGNVENMEQNMTSAHAMKKADLGKQLRELSKALSMKEELAKKMTSNDTQITAMRDQYEAKLLELDKNIQNLAKEKTSLELALQQAQKSSESRKLSEKRRQRLAELSAQILDLKKEKKEKEKLIRMKTESDRSITRLNHEIQQMKRNRVNLMKQIKAENEKFNIWKKEKAKEVKQLQEKNRKRNFEYVKLERTYDKQKAILRRKTEEAAAANKRLKEAIHKQQTAASKRRANEKRTMEGAGPKIRAWLDEEIEVLTSIKEVEHHLNVLLDDRKTLARELQSNTDSPSKRRRTFCAENDGVDKKQEMRQEMKLKNAQIQDLQNKLAEAKEHHTGNTRWVHISTMLDAKCALKYLLQLVVSTKLEVDKQKSENLTSKHEREAAESLVNELQYRLRQIEHEHEKDRTILEQTHQDRISCLMGQTSSVSEDVFEKVVSKQATEINTLKDERKELHRQLLEQRTSSTTTPHKTNQSFFKPLKQINQSVDDIFEEEGDDEVDWEPSFSGSEYEPTPQKRLKQRKQGCGCSKTKTQCKSGNCGCVKKGNRCDKECKCEEESCFNREQSGNGTFVKSTEDTMMTEDSEPTDTSTPTGLFPKLTGKFDKENTDILFGTPSFGNEKSSQYRPVYFNSPLTDQN